MLIDPFGRAITYLRISVTDRCNLRCAYCLPESGVKWLPDVTLLTADEIIRVAQAGARLGINKIRLTGGEPLVRPDVLEIVKRIKEIPGVTDLSLTTNGMLLEKLSKPLFESGLDRVNISLDTLDPVKFKNITRLGDFQKVWNGILAAEAVGLAPIKLNAVVVGGINQDEIPALASLSIEHPWHVRFIELMPVANEQEWGDGLPSVSGRYISVQKMHAILEPLKMETMVIEKSVGPERTFKIPGALGTVGFISPLGENFCNKCNRLRLTADGWLRSCLLVDKEISLREALMTGADLETFISKAVSEKPEGHQLKSHNCPDARHMSQIGG
jgi:GTP 3',8-cyclase